MKLITLVWVRRMLCLLVLFVLVGLAGSALAQTSVFTYQGRLVDNGAAANGDYDFQFTLFDASSAGNVVGSAVVVAPVTVADGVFTVSLDFGATAFDGSGRWLDIGVRPNGSSDAYTLLTPRQAFTSSPYAIRSAVAGTAGHATTAGSATTATSVSGSVPTSQLTGLIDANKHFTVNSIQGWQINDGSISGNKLWSSAIGNRELDDKAVTLRNLDLGARNNEIRHQRAGYVSGSGNMVTGHTYFDDFPAGTQYQISIATPGWSPVGPVNDYSFTAQGPFETGAFPANLDFSSSSVQLDGEEGNEVRILGNDTATGKVVLVQSAPYPEESGAQSFRTDAWTVTQIADGPGQSLSLNDRHACFIRQGVLYYAHWDYQSSSYTVHTVGPATAEAPTSLEFVQNNGFPSIAYGSGGGGQPVKLHYAFPSAQDGSGTWTIREVAADGILAGPDCLKGRDGHPVIVYRNSSGLHFTYSVAADGSGTWNTVSISTAPTSRASLGSGFNRNTVVYVDGADNLLKWATNTVWAGTGVWTSTVVDSVLSGSTGQFLSSVSGYLGGDQGEGVLIAYRDGNQGALKLAVSNEDGTTWHAVTVDQRPGDTVTSPISFALADGIPFIVYRTSEATPQGTVNESRFATLPALDFTLTDGSVAPLVAARVADGAITAPQLALGSVTTASILDGTITVADLAATIGLWDRTGLNVHYTAGNVGIGKTDPATALDVNGIITATSFVGDGSGLANVPAAWQTVSGTAQTGEPNRSYFLANDTLSTLTLPATASVGDVVSVSGAGGWQVTPNAGQFIAGHFTDPGEVWTARESVRQWGDIATSADGTKWVAVAAFAPILTSTDGGVTWTPRASSSLHWGAVGSSADGSVLVAGVTTAGPGGGHLHVSTDSGETWTARNTDQDRNWLSIAASADGTKWVAVAFNGQIFTSTDSGTNWTARESIRQWRGVASSDDGIKLVAVASNGQIYTSTDSGFNWTARESSRNWYDVASSADGTKLVAVVSGGQIYTSTDSGVTWTARENSRNWYGVASSADGTRLVATARGGQIYTSTDSGATWTPRDSARNWHRAASSADGTRLVAVVGGFSTGQIYVSEPPGPASLTGTAGTAARLQYAGDGRWQPIGEALVGSGVVGDAQISAVDAAKLTSGTLPDARLSSAVTTSLSLASTATDANTASAIVRRDASGNFTAGIITATLNGNATTATSATSAENFTGTLSGDVTGTQGTTAVASVGGQSAANVATATSLANAATDANTASAIVRRDASGNFTAGTITAALNGNATTATSATSATSAENFTGTLSGDVTGTQGTTAVASVGGQSAANVATATGLANAATDANTASTIVRRDGSGNFTAGTITATLDGNAATATSATSFTGTLSGDVTGTQGATAVASVGGQSAANVATATGLANAATDANTAGAIVRRDGSGNFTAGTITAALDGNAATATSFTGTLSGDVTGTQGATVVASVGGQTAANVASGASAANAATDANTAGAIVRRDASGNFTAATITATLNGNASTATSFTGNLSGDITGTQGSTTVASVGGETAANVAAGAVLANAATSANTASALVRRDASGNFSAGVVSATILQGSQSGTFGQTVKIGTRGGTPDSQTLALRVVGAVAGSWRGGGAFGDALSSVIMGELNGVATIGGHATALNAWADLSINSGGGNVGIRKTDPAYPLDVNGVARATSFIGESLGLGVTPASGLHLKQSADGTGTDDSNGGLRLERSATSDYWQIENWSDDDLVFRHSGGAAFAYIRDTDGTFQNSSDRRLKKDILPLGNVMNELMRLDPVTFRFKSAPDNAPKTYGFIAQEVEAVFPDLVSDKGGFKAVSYSAFGPLAIAGMQELNRQFQSEVKEREAELQALRSRVAELEARDKARDARLIRMERMLEGIGGLKEASLVNGGVK